MFEDLDQFVLATNNGSLYYITDNQFFIIFASEGFFLQKLKKDSCFIKFNEGLAVRQLVSNQGLVISLSNLKIDNFTLPVNKQRFHSARHLFLNYRNIL